MTVAPPARSGTGPLGIRTALARRRLRRDITGRSRGFDRLLRIVRPALDVVAWLSAAGGVTLIAVLTWAALSPATFRTGPVDDLARPGDWRPVLALWVFVAVGLWAHRFPRRREPRSYGLVLAAFLTVLALGLGTVSYWGCEGDRSPFFVPFSWALGLFAGSVETPFGQPGCAQSPPVSLDVAHLAALSVTFGSAAAVVLTVFRRRWDRLRARYLRVRTLVIEPDGDSVPAVLGLARSLPRAEIVVIAEDADGPTARTLRREGMPVLAAGSVDRSLLAAVLLRARRPQVDAVYALSPSASVNEAWIDQVEGVLRETNHIGIHHAPRLILRSDNPWVAEDTRRSRISGEDPWVLDAVSAFEETARHILSRLPEATDGEVVTLVLVGDSDLAFALLAERAQCERENQVVPGMHPAVDVVLVGRGAKRLREDHELRQRRFGQAGSGSIRVGGDDADETVILRSASVVPVAVVVLAAEPGPEQEHLAIRLAAKAPDLTVYQWRDQANPIPRRPRLGSLHTFGVSITPDDRLPSDGWSRIGRLLHERYRLRYPNPDDPARRPWEQLAWFYRQSNVRNILCLLRTARDRGYSWEATEADVPRVTPDDLPAEEITEFARTEHLSWLQHHRDAGWRAGGRDPSRLRHDKLKPWDQLPPTGSGSREGTESQVREGIALLGTLGYVMTSPWREYARTGTVTATRLTANREWQTKAGDAMRGVAGDWLVTGPDGSERTVTDTEFAASHTHVRGDVWRRTGTYRARRAKRGERALSPEGTTVAHGGEWLLENRSGHRWLVPDLLFRATYRPLTDDVGGDPAAVSRIVAPV